MIRLNLTENQVRAMVDAVRDGRRSPDKTGLPFRTYLSLGRRNLMRCVSGYGNSSVWDLTEDGAAWARDNV